MPGPVADELRPLGHEVGVVTDSGHVVHHDHPDGFAAALHDRLRRGSAGPEDHGGSPAGQREEAASRPERLENHR
ncbi:hypothetical protein [Streptomyces rubradiris]|uniref:hypothetical protein n=1 Tax=Streptomyces rubradiris TaxID=285531 RepID=UPI0016764A9C|nr:hypothetical protein [Streptomyces rubradiris]